MATPETAAPVQQRTINPSGPTIVQPLPSGPPSEPDSSVIERQDPTHTEAAFMRDLGRVTQRSRSAS